MRRSKFSLSNYKLFSCDMGELIPCGLMEVLPGDSIQQSTQALIRASPLLAPVMHPVHVSIRHFFVPFRLIWEDWEDFITGGPDGMNAAQYPTLNLDITNTSANVGQLADYLGCVPGIQGLAVSALPFRAYMMIYNEFYRDQDLQVEMPISKASGLDNFTARLLAHVNWEKDYFTSARPWEQKGPAITIPLGTQANIVSNNADVQVRLAVDPGVDRGLQTSATANDVVVSGSVQAASNVRFGTETGLLADLTGASAITVTLLRQALALQRYEEARARFGSRYTEYLRYLGVTSSDARLQRPEYLGGGRQTIQFSEVLATAEGENTDVGDLKGHGIGSMRSNRYRRFFEEHGLVLSLMHVRPKTIYLNGLPRLWNKRTKEDYWQKELQHIGQQKIKNKEIYAAGADPEATFGYQDRYDEYRRVESMVAGEFRTSTLNHWHFARDFGSPPSLNASFVECVPTERTFAVPSEDVLYIMAHHSVQARRLVAATGSSFIY